MITVVLVEPEVPGNVGFTARTLACYGLSDLRIVGRPGLSAHPEARRTVSGGEAVLSATRDFADLPAAVADCTYAFGFSRRTRDPAQRILDLPDAVNLVHGPGIHPGIAGNVALVFGCESQGLSREDTLRLSHLVRIRLPDSTLSLNLSHAVAIALHAFVGTASDDDRSAVTSHDDFPTMAESEGVLAAVIATLTDRNLLRPAKAEAQAEYLRMLWQRLRPSRRELEFLAGLLKKMAASGPDAP